MKKSFLEELIQKLVLTLCVPFVATILIFWQANQILKEEIMLSSEKSLEIFSSQMDEITRTSKDVCTYLLQEPDSVDLLKTYLRTPSREHSLRLQICSLLEGLRRKEFYEIFVYLYENDRIISSNFGSQGARDHWAAYYEPNGISYEDFQKIICCENSMFTSRRMKTDGEQSYLCVTTGIRNKARPELNYTIGIVYSPEKIKQLFEQGDLEERGGILLLNENNELLWDGTGGKTQDLTLQDFEKMQKETGGWQESNDCIYMTKAAGEGKNSYVYIVESSYFWKTLERLNRISIILLLACLCVGILLIAHNSHILYRPLKNIIEQLKSQDNEQLADSTNREFSYITDYVNGEKTRAKRDRSAINNLYLYKLLNGLHTENEFDYESEKKIFGAGDNYLVCIVQKESAEEEEICEFVVTNVFDELCNSVGVAYNIELYGGNRIFIINAEEKTADIWKFLRQGIEFCKNYFQIMVTVGCSRWHEGASHISDAYKEAMESIRYKYILGTGIQIRYEEVLEKKTQSKDGRFEQALLLLLDYVRGETKFTAEEIWEGIEVMFHVKGGASLESVLAYRNEVINIFQEVLEICACTNVPSSMLTDLQAVSTANDFRKQFLLKLSEIKEACNNTSEGKEKYEVCLKALAYIDENYSDNMLSVNSLGEKLGIQSAYLSRLFKEWFGISILDYVSLVRIEHAKTLVHTSNMPVQKIAEITGYLSSHVFIKKFKEIVGMTPGKYREINCHNDKKTGKNATK